MSDAAKKFFESLRNVRDGVQAITPSIKEIFSQVGPEISRLGTQGSMEIASAFFNGSAFVPYGPGQYTPSPEQTNSPQSMSEQEHSLQHEQGLER